MVFVRRSIKKLGCAEVEAPVRLCHQARDFDGRRCRQMISLFLKFLRKSHDHVLSSLSHGYQQKMVLVGA